jgi:hypothetical protein
VSSCLLECHCYHYYVDLSLCQVRVRPSTVHSVHTVLWTVAWPCVGVETTVKAHSTHLCVVLMAPLTTVSVTSIAPPVNNRRESLYSLEVSVVSATVTV